MAAVTFRPGVTLDGLDPEVREAFRRAVADLTKLGIPASVATVTSAHRSTEKQAALYASRASNPNPVAPPGTSAHETGHALDITTTEEYRPFLVQVMKNAGFGWGGEFKGRKDPVHYYWRGVRAGDNPFAAAAASKTVLGHGRGVLGEDTDNPFAAAAASKSAARPAPSTQHPAPSTPPTQNPLFGLLNRPGDIVRAAEQGMAPAFGQAKAQYEGMQAMLLRAHQTGQRPHLSALPSVEPAGQSLARAAGAARSRATAPLTTPSPVPPGDLPGLALDFFLNPGDQLVGGFVGKLGRRVLPPLARAFKKTPAGARVAEGVTAVARSVEANPFTSAARSKLATAGAAVDRGLDRLGVGPASRQVRELQRPYDREIGRRSQELGGVVQAIRDRQIELRLVPGAEGGAQAFRARREAGLPIEANEARRLREQIRPLRKNAGAGRSLTPEELSDLAGTAALRGTPHPLPTRRGFVPKGVLGAGPLETAVRQYVDRAVLEAEGDLGSIAKRGFTIPHGIRDYLALTSARPLGVPWQDVRHFGDALLDEYESTLLRASQGGAHPFAQFQSQESAARSLVGDVRRFMRHSFSYPAEGELAQAGGAAFAGAPAIRNAVLRNVEHQLVDTGIARSVEGGRLLPGHVVVPRNKLAFSQALHDLQVPQPVYRFLQNEALKAGRNTANTTAVLGRLEEPEAEGLRKGLGVLARYAGLQKKAWLSQLPVLFGNAVGNHLAASLALREHGVSPALLGEELARTIPATRRFEKTGELSARMRQLNQHTDAFLNTQARTTGLAGAKTHEAIAGMTGEVKDRLPGLLGGEVKLDRPVYFPPQEEQQAALGNSLIGLHGTAERAYKLALFNLLQPKIGARRAAETVERYLFNYGDRHPILAALDRYGLWAFNHFPIQAQRLFLETLAKSPEEVARYARLRQALFTRIPGSEAARAGMRPDQQENPALFPVGVEKKTGKPVWFDASRYLYFTGAATTTRETFKAIKEGRLPSYLTPGELSNLPQHSVFGPALSAFVTNRTGMSTADEPAAIAKPGTPPETRAEDRVRYLVEQMFPLVGQAARINRAASGSSPASRYRTGEPATVPEEALRALTGYRTVSGEGREEALARTKEPALRRARIAKEEARRALDFYRAVGPDGTTRLHKNPYADLPELAAATDALALKGKFGEAKTMLVKTLLDPRVVSAQGHLLDPARIRRQVAYLAAIADRMAAAR